MNKKVLFAAFAVVFAALSCSKEAEPVDNTQEPEVIVPQQEVLVPYTLTAGAPPTKTAIDGSGNVVWSADDAIKVYYDGGSAESSEIELASGGASATFTVMLPDGMASSDKLYAVYPATTDASLSGSTFSIVVPGEQTGKFEDVNIVVAATTVGEHTLSFKQVLSFVNFTVSAGNPKAITRALFKDLYGTAIVGTLPVTFDASGNATPGTAAATGTEVSLTAVQVGKNYIAVLPGVALKSIGLKLGSSSAWFTPLASDTDATIERGHSKPLGTVDTKVGDAWYFKETASGNGDGTSWENAGDAGDLGLFLNTSKTYNKARVPFQTDGLEIRVAEGTYELDLGLDFSTASHFSIKGGYASDGTADSAKKATFTGNDSHRIVWIGNDNQNINITFENILFTHGTDGASSSHGGALKIMSGSHTFRNCAFTLNQNIASGRNGGALYYDPGTSHTDQTITISDCVFGGDGDASLIKNIGMGLGSALYLANCVATVTNTDFLNNSFPNAQQYSDALNGAAVYIGDRMEASFTDCDFKWNYGGAIRISGSTAISGRKVALNNCFLWKNTCNYWGGGIHTDSPIPLFLNKCMFSGNKGTGHGGHISQSGSTSFVGINNCAFYGATNTKTDVDAADVWLDGKSVVANSSLVGKGATIVFRYANYYDGSVLVNCLNYAEDKGVWGTPRLSTSGSDVLHGSYNLFRGNAGTADCYSSSNDKKVGPTFSDIGGTVVNHWINGVTLDYTYTDGVPNPTLKQVETAIKSEATHGTAFYNWLVSVDGVAKDAYGNPRSDANNRPGALVK